MQQCAKLMLEERYVTISRVVYFVSSVRAEFRTNLVRTDTPTTVYTSTSRERVYVNARRSLEINRRVHDNAETRVSLRSGDRGVPTCRTTTATSASPY
jgi:hypothetical protein